MSKTTCYLIWIQNVKVSIISALFLCTCEVRRLDEMCNQSRIFDCFGGRFGKVVFNLKLANLIDSEVASDVLLILELNSAHVKLDV